MRRPLLVLTLAGLLAVAGCGEDESSDDATTSAATAAELSAEEYAQEVNSILDQFGDEQEELIAEENEIAEGPRSRESYAAYTAVTEEKVRGTEEAIAALAAVSPPAAAQEGHDQVATALEDYSAYVGAFAEALKAKDFAAGRALERDYDSFLAGFVKQMRAAVESLSAAGVKIETKLTNSPS